MAAKSNIPELMAIHPGRILKEEIKERGVSQKTLAKEMGMQESHLSEIIKGKRPITGPVADNLERALGIPSIDWMNLQIKFDYDTRQNDDLKTAESLAYTEILEYNKTIDVKVLTNRLNFSHPLSSKKIEFLKNTLNLPAPELLVAQAKGLFKKSDKVGKNPRMIMTWMILARYFAQNQNITNSFDAQQINALVPVVCKILHSNKDTINRLTSTFAQYGIIFGVVEKVEGASIDGYSFEHEGHPCIVVTKRFDRIDNLAFSVMHELGHIAHDDNEDNRLDLADYDHESTAEKRANSFAANALIPDAEWRKMPASRLTSSNIQRVCTSWAEENGYNKWIALGRLSHETGMYKFKTDSSRRIS